MKNLIIAFSILTIAVSANAQKLKEADVPSAVKTQFFSIYPGAKVTKWEKENGKYEAEFNNADNNNVQTSVLFEANGTYVQTEVEIPVNTLPAAVKDYVSQNLSGQTIKEATKITDAQGVITYETEIGKSDYMFDSKGNYLRSETEDPKKDDSK